MPETVANEMKDFIDSIYGITPDDRLFPVSKSYLHHEMDRGVKESGVKRIRVHDLRHSHVSLLINMGFSAVEELFCSGYARYFWEAIKLRYPEYCFYIDLGDLYDKA